MKTCTKCGESKPLDQFYSHKSKPDGKAARCRTCHSAASKDWRAVNKAKVARSNRAYLAANKAEKAALSQAWYQANKSEIAVKSKALYHRSKAQKSARDARRRALKLRAIPRWADPNEISAIYREAECLRSLGLDVHVDHIIPLQGVNVTGLHVHTNLQILLAVDNLTKGNRLTCP